MDSHESSISSAAYCRICGQSLTTPNTFDGTNHDLEMCAAAQRARTRILLESKDNGVEQMHYREARWLVQCDIPRILERYGAQDVRSAALELVWSWRQMERRGWFEYEEVLTQVEDEGLIGDLKDVVLRILEWCGSGILEIMGIEDGLLLAGMSDARTAKNKHWTKIKRQNDGSGRIREKYWNDVQDVDQDRMIGVDVRHPADNASNSDETSDAQNLTPMGEELNGGQNMADSEMLEEEDAMETGNATSFDGDTSAVNRLDFKEEPKRSYGKLDLARKQPIISGAPFVPSETTTPETSVTTEYTTTPQRLCRADNKRPINAAWSQEQDEYLLRLRDTVHSVYQQCEEFNAYSADQGWPLRTIKALQTRIRRLEVSPQKSSALAWPEDQEEFLIHAYRGDRPVKDQIENLNASFEQRGWPSRSLKAVQAKVSVLRQKFRDTKDDETWPKEQEKYLLSVAEGGVLRPENLQAFNAYSRSQGWPTRSLVVSQKYLKKLRFIGKGNEVFSARWPKEQEEYLSRTIRDGIPVAEQVQDFNDQSQAHGWPVRSLKAIETKKHELRGPARGTSKSWPDEQLVYLSNIMQDGIPAHAQIAAFNDYSESQGWPTRSIRGLANKMSKLREKAVEPE